MRLVEAFFRELDAAWRWPAADKVRLRIIGSAALMLQTSYERGTKDSDVLETLALTPAVKQRLLEVAGPHSNLHRRLRLYVDIVGSGLPLLPRTPRCHPVALALRHFEVEVLDVVDVVVSKLKRFSANDQADIEAMIERDRVPHAVLRERFQSALELELDGARADDVPRYVRHLNRIERDLYGATESSFELPSWIAD